MIVGDLTETRLNNDSVHKSHRHLAMGGGLEGKGSGFVKFYCASPKDMNYINICIIYIGCAPL